MRLLTAFNKGAAAKKAFGQRHVFAQASPEFSYSFDLGTEGGLVGLSSPGDAYNKPPDNPYGSLGVFAAAAATHGAFGMRVAFLSGVSANGAAGWQLGPLSGVDIFGRFYFNIDGTNTATARIFGWFDHNLAACGYLRLNTANKIQALNAAGTGIGSATTTALTASTVYRIEWRVLPDVVSGEIEFNLYQGESLTPLENNLSTGAVLKADVFEVRVGVTNAVTQTADINFDYDSFAVTPTWSGPISQDIGTPYEDSDTAAWIMGASAVEAPIYGDSDTAAFTFTPSFLEEHDIFDSDTAAYVSVASATELHTISDAGVANSVLVASASETHIISDIATAAWIITPSAADIAQYLEANTAQYLSTVSATETTQSVDAATASWTNVASAVEAHTITDTATAAFSFVASAVEVEASVDAATAQNIQIASSLEEHDLFDNATAAWVMTPSTADIQQFVDTDTAAWILTASAVELTPNADADTAAWILHAYPDVVTQILHDTFTRTTTNDFGTADDGTTYVHGAGSSANMFVSVDHGVMLAPNGTSQVLSQFITTPNTNSRFLVKFQSTVLFSQASGQVFQLSFRTRADLLTAGNNYEFRATINSGGAISGVLVRVDAGIPTTLSASAVAYTSGNWSTSDIFNFEGITNGTLLELRIWRTTDDRPSTPLRSYDISGDATQYASGQCFQVRMNSSAVVSADEEYDLLALDIWSLDETAQTVETNTAAFAFTASAAEEHDIPDTDTAQNVYTPSAAEVHTVFDSSTAAYVLTASASEIYAPASFDTATAAYVLTAGATEVRVSTETGTAAWVLSGSATTESHVVLDAGQAAFAFTAGGTDLPTYADAATAAWVTTPSSVLAFAGNDVGTGAWVMTAQSFEEFGKIDTGTGQWVFTPLSLEEHDLFDDATVQQFYTASTPSEFLVQDADTAAYVLLPSAVEGVGASTDDTCVLNFVASGVETFQGSDAATADVAFFVFIPSTIEQFQILDYYLESVQSHRWSLNQVHHFDVIQSDHYVVSQTHRWGVIYKGRGFFSG